MSISIYGLYHPHDLTIIRYVGKTKNTLRQRLSSHISEARSGSANLRCHWIRRLIADGLLPVIRLLEEADADTWEECERRLIAHHKGTITNGTDGGNDGGTGRPTEVEGGKTRRLYAGEANWQWLCDLGDGEPSTGLRNARKAFESTAHERTS